MIGVVSKSRFERTLGVSRTRRLVDLAFLVVLVVALGVGYLTGLSPTGLGVIVAVSLGLEFAASYVITDSVLRGVDDEAVPTGPIRRIVDEMSETLGVEPADVFVDSAGETGVSVLGNGNRTVLLVSGDVFDHLDEQALKGVITHELAHISLGHLRRVPVREATAHVVGLVALWAVLLQWLTPSIAIVFAVAYLIAGFSQRNGPNGFFYVAGSLGLVLVPLALGAYASRLEECQADDVAVEHTSPESFCTGLYRITAETAGSPLGGVGGETPTGQRPGLFDRLTAVYPTIEYRLARQGIDVGRVAKRVDGESRSGSVAAEGAGTD